VPHEVLDRDRPLERRKVKLVAVPWRAISMETPGAFFSSTWRAMIAVSRSSLSGIKPTFSDGA
jgi:hypothetical protein